MKYKNAVIIFDGGEAAKKAARGFEEAAKARGEAESFRLVTFADFSATDILGADFIVLAASSERPEHSEYLYKVLRHINLAGRDGAVAAPTPQVEAALKEALRDSELRIA